ncbi:MAG: metallophosphoesterase [Planctomycetes bacterium]|nr:metallophosphoesterase [Planctomycetota bacterium]
MRPISPIRQRIESEERHHIVKRGVRGRFHFENLPALIDLLDWGLTVTCLKPLGIRQALEVRLETVDISLARLPEAWDGTRLLFLSDLHIDGNEPLVERIMACIQALEYDVCCLGGDYGFGWHGSPSRANELISEIATQLVRCSPVYGILGNHDCYHMGQCLEQAGVTMLVNEAVRLEREGEPLYVVGLDDGHYFGADDIEQAMETVPPDACTLLLAHTPELHKKGRAAHCDLCLSGHTHGGQVCLPGGIHLVTSASVPRRMIKGPWQSGAMTGYTSRGAGTSGLPIRYSCPPEITLIKLNTTKRP